MMVREMVRVAGNEMGGAGMGSSNDDMGGDCRWGIPDKSSKYHSFSITLFQKVNVLKMPICNIFVTFKKNNYGITITKSLENKEFCKNQNL